MAICHHVGMKIVLGFQARQDVFPYREYHSMGDDHVRPTHAALNGIVLPVDHEFWQTHFPPWEFGCRCQVISISQDDHDDIKKTDKKKAPDNRQILDQNAQSELTLTRRLVRNGVTFNMTAPSETNQPGAFAWNPGSLHLPADQLRERYAGHPQQWHEFSSWAKATAVPDRGYSVWDWICGHSKIVPPGAPAPQPVAIAKLTFEDSLKRLHLDTKLQWDESDVIKLFAQAKQKKPGKAKDAIKSITGATGSGPLGKRAIVRAIKDIVNLIPPNILSQLPPLEVEVTGLIAGKTDVLGNYANGKLRLSRDVHASYPSESPRKTIFHELMHFKWATSLRPAKG